MGRQTAQKLQKIVQINAHLCFLLSHLQQIAERWFNVIFYTFVSVLAVSLRNALLLIDYLPVKYGNRRLRLVVRCDHKVNFFEFIKSVQLFRLFIAIRFPVPLCCGIGYSVLRVRVRHFRDLRPNTSNEHRGDITPHQRYQHKHCSILHESNVYFG